MPAGVLNVLTADATQSIEIGKALMREKICSILTTPALNEYVLLEVLIFLRQSDSTWKPQSLQLHGDNLGDAKAVKAADLNGDGFPDIVAWSPFLDRVVLLEVKDGALYLNKSKVTTADVKCSNGVIHIIDTVLMPPTAK